MDLQYELRMLTELGDIGVSEIARTLMAGGSAAMTAYFWLVRSRREKPQLDLYQLSNFRPSLRSQPGKEDVKRLCLAQIDTGGVLIANNSTRQNSILKFECYLDHQGERIQGDWGYGGEDKPPMECGARDHHRLQPSLLFRGAKRLRNARRSELSHRASDRKWQAIWRGFLADDPTGRLVPCVPRFFQGAPLSVPG